VAVRETLAFLDERVLREGDYLVVEDTVDADKARTLASFLEAPPSGAEYKVDAHLCDYFGPNVCWNPNAYLRRMS